jgi:plastocyanin domain-containing protein
MRAAVVVATLAILAFVFGCKRDDERGGAKASPTTPAVATRAADGVRHVPVEAGKNGYVPDRIVGKPSEKLVLEVTRTVDGDCLRQVVMPDKKSFELPLNQKLDIPVTVPASGEVTFACGMDMFRGVIVAQP